MPIDIAFELCYLHAYSYVAKSLFVFLRMLRHSPKPEVPRISQKYSVALLGALQRIYSIRELDAYFRVALKELLNIIEADWSWYSEFKPRTGEFTYWIIPESVNVRLNAPPVHRTLTNLVYENPVLTYAIRTGHRSALKFSDFWTQKQLHNSVLYREVLKKEGLSDNLECFLRSPKGSVIRIGLCRRKGLFSENERRLLDCLRPHIDQALLNLSELSQLRDKVRKVQQSLLANISESAVVRPDAGYKVLARSSQKSPLDESFDGTINNSSQLSKNLSHARNQKPGRSDVQMHPTRLDENQKSGLAVRDTYVSEVSFPWREQGPDASVQMERVLCYLTAREAEILMWAADGKTNADIAIILAVSQRTVEKHLEHVFTKLGVETRTAAAAWYLKATHDATT
jgi:DNA-binding CsgD family transcriptional regulator